MLLQHPLDGQVESSGVWQNLRHRSQTAAVEKGEPTFVQEIVMLGRDTA
jgi:hypothetical protein